MKKLFVGVLVLLSIGVNAYARSLDDELRSAISNNKTWQSVKLLVQGANPVIADEQGITALQLAIAKKMHPVIELMLAMTNKLDDADARGWSPLFYSIQNGSLLTSVELLKGGADANQRERITGMSPLEYSIQISKTTMAKALIDNGANLDGADDFGNTALLYALDKPNFDSLLFLHDRFGDFKSEQLHHRNNNGEGALTFAAQAQNLEGAGLLWMMGYNDREINLAGLEASFYFSESNQKIWLCMKQVLSVDDSLTGTIQIPRIVRTAVRKCSL